MNGLVSVYKPKSLTPYQLVEKLRLTLGIDKAVKIGYAGRLDPLASGVLILMIGDVCKDREIYQNMTKTYRFDLIFGLSTDTIDPLGIVTQISKTPKTINENDLKNSLSNFTGEISQKYPLYSSYAINGTPMYKLSKEGKIKDSDRPIKKVNIFELQLLNLAKIECSSLFDEFISAIKATQGEFRQEEIVKTWESNVDELPQQLYSATLLAKVSSGTYVRSLGEDIAGSLGDIAMVYNIERVKVGEFKLEDSLFYESN